MEEDRRLLARCCRRRVKVCRSSHTYMDIARGCKVVIHWVLWLDLTTLQPFYV